MPSLATRTRGLGVNGGAGTIHGRGAVGVPLREM
jgi:hypothetical protein